MNEMNKDKELSGVEKKQLNIFLAVNFGLTVLMGILMWVSYHNGNDVSAFAATQMMYPAAGVILAIIITAGKEKKLPMRFFVTFLVTAALAILLTAGNVIMPSTMWYAAENVVFVIGSIISWIMLLTEKKEVRDGCNLRFGAHDMKKSLLLILLFFVLYLARLFLSGLLDGSVKEIAGLFAKPVLWANMVMLAVNFYITFIIFFGEEYGWRYFLQPMLQKRFGLKGGVLLLGVIWGLWHLPLSISYYSPETWFYSILIQVIGCVSFGVFFGYAYGKTGNIWVPVAIHFINNNMSALLAGGDLGNQVYRWQDTLSYLQRSIKDRLQIFNDHFCCPGMGFLSGMGMRSDGLVCGIRKLEKSKIAVSGFFLVGVHGVRNGKSQVIA